MELEKTYGVPRSKQATIPLITQNPLLANNDLKNINNSSIVVGNTMTNNQVQPNGNNPSVTDNAPIIDEKYIELDLIYSL